METTTTATPIGGFYLERQREIDAKYPQSIVMIEIGKFYEVYTFETDDGDCGGAKEVSRVCNIVLTRKNKNLPVSMSNPHMCGFPSHSLSRYVGHLVDHGFTVAVYEQRTTGSEGMTRRLKGVYSPSTLVGLDDDDMKSTERCLIGMRRIDVDRSSVILVSVAVNTTNGAVSCHEETIGVDEVSTYVKRHVDIYRPSEVLSDGVDINKNQIPIKWETRFQEVEFQEKVLENVYPRDKAHLSIIDEIGLAYYPDIVSLLVYMIVFLQDHHPLSVYRLCPPSIGNSTHNMYYSPNALYDLNILGDGDNSIFSLLNRTATPSGKRLLHKKIITPVVERRELEKSYDDIASFLPRLDDFDLKKRLCHYAVDMEAVFRRLLIGNTSVVSVVKLWRHLEDVHILLDDIWSLQSHKENETQRKERLGVLGVAHERWDCHLMKSWRSWDTDGVWRTTPRPITDLESEYGHIESGIHNWIRTTWNDDMIQRLVYTEDEAFFQFTKKTFREVKMTKDMRSKVLSSNVRVYHETLDSWCVKRRNVLTKLAVLRRKTFCDEVRGWVNGCEKCIRTMLDMCARVDVIISCARCADTYRLCRPVLCDDAGERRLKIGSLRHLIVEQSSQKYVSNDIDVSHILLFGQNSAGKCFKRDTDIVMWDGSVKHVQDVREGDVLIGQNKTSRSVLSTSRGYGCLFEVVRTDTGSVLMTVTENHILCLTDQKKTDIIEATVSQVLMFPYSFQGWMYQCTCYIRENNNEKRIDRCGETDDEWVALYVNLLKDGCRIKTYTSTCIESDGQRIVPIEIRRHKGGDEEYYGFEVDGDRRFILPDGTLAHNSTLMKSVGVAVLMAQSGMYVPASSIEMTPIHSLFTKIGSRDNIWKGHSTFITEMSELKHILDRSSSSSLILCDELTSGTETFSATGIVASTLMHLIDKKSLFILTTHLHTLKTLPEVVGEKRLKIMHLGMEYNASEKRLVFDRVLREGMGRSVYGLEIAEYLGFSQGFIQKAYAFRSQLDIHDTSVVPTRRSRYNRKKWVDKCARCGATKNLHTHHILPQALASEDGYIGVHHKDVVHNLMILCRECHEKEHHP
jgi:DNA mismatch repair ATPase MutS